VFIIRIFTGSVIGIIFGILLSLFGLFVLFAIVLGALAVTGGPGDCTPGGGPITVDAANSTSFQQKWDAFNDVLDAGSPSSVTLSESEISSRAQSYLDEKDTPFKDARVCIHDGKGEGQAKMKFLGLTMKFKVTGTMQLDGAHPKAHIDSIDIGNIPGWMIGPAERVVNRGINGALDDVDLDHKYTPVLTPGQAAVGGTP
jgi:hypothetical protein